MLTFIVNAKLFGMAPYSFKLTNLLIHLACGGVIYALLSRLLLRAPQWNPHASLAALIISAAWLLHPLQVSTVLYIVQRMAQLSTLSILLALLAFVHGREALEQGRARQGVAWLFLTVPAITLLGILCKENAALAPLLCAVLELGYFHDTVNTPRPLSVKAFFWLGLILPMLAAIVWYAWQPSRLLAGYNSRTFTLGQRLLSEPRALFDYIGSLLLPRGPTLGLYTDDFQASQGLWQPITTMWALLGLLALVAIAIRTRRHTPAVFTGITFFLAGHAMESSIFPLELYFEHRNYLPSVGLFLALAGIIKWGVDRRLKSQPRPSHSRLWVFCAFALCAALAGATAARAWVWQSWSTIVRQAVIQHPDSTRAQLDNLSIVWNTMPAKQTQNLLNQLMHSNNPVTRHVAVISNLLHECQTTQAIDPKSLENFIAITSNKLQLAEMGAIEQLGAYLREKNCDGLDKVTLADILRKIANSAPQPPSNTAVWRVRFMATDLYTRGGKPLEAQKQAVLTWNTGQADPAVGVLLARLQLYNRDFSGARQTLAQLHSRVPAWDRRNQAAMMDVEHHLPL